MDSQFAFSADSPPPSVRPASRGSNSSTLQPTASTVVPYPHAIAGANVTASVLQPVKEDVPFTSPPLSSGGLASMHDASSSSRLDLSYRPLNNDAAPAVDSGFGGLVTSSFGASAGSIEDIWGAPGEREATASPFRHDAFLASSAPYTAVPSGLSTPYEPFPAPPSTAALIAARPYTANAASALVFMSQSGSVDSVDGGPPVGSPVFAADAMLQHVTQDGARFPGMAADSYSARPGSSSQKPMGGGAVHDAQLPPPPQPQQQTFAYAPPYAATRNSFAMENLSLHPAPASSSQMANVSPNYHQPPAQALQYAVVTPTSSHSRPTSSHGGPDRRALQQTTAGFTSRAMPPRAHTISSTNRTHPYSRPAYNSMSAASGAPVPQGWPGMDSASFAQVYQQQAVMRPQTSDGVPLSYYGGDWDIAAPILPGAGIPPSSYAPPSAFAPHPSNRPSTSYAAQTASLFDNPRIQPPPGTFSAPPRSTQSRRGSTAHAKLDLQQQPSSIAPPAVIAAFPSAAPPPPPPPLPPPPPPPPVQGRQRSNTTAGVGPKYTAAYKAKAKKKPAESDSDHDDGDDAEDDADDGAKKPPEREISAVTGRPKRPRRKFEEVERNYVCNFADCGKAYGTLNHLNAHVLSQGHGPKRMPVEFRELRKIWRRQRREKAAAEKSDKGKGKGKRKSSAATTSTDKRRKASADADGSNGEDARPSAGGSRRQSMISRTSTVEGEGDEEEDSSEEDERYPSHVVSAVGNGTRRYSSPAFVSAVPTPPTTIVGNLGNYPSPLYNLDIPAYNGPASAHAILAAQQQQHVQQQAASPSAPSPFADWSFAHSPSVPSLASVAGSGVANPAAFLAPTPGMYETVSLDFDAGAPSEASTTAGTPRINHY